MQASILFHILAGLAYAVLGIHFWYAVLGKSNSSNHSACPINMAGHILIILALCLHAIGLSQAIIVKTGLHIGWALALSVALWLGMIIFWVESFLLKIEGLLLLLLPSAAIACILAAVFPNGYLIPHADNDWLRIHLLISMAAYALITIAAIHAALMTIIDKYLHKPFSTSGQTSWVASVISAMPALLVLEKLLFRMIWIGFVILSLSVFSGIIVSMSISNQFLPTDHKTVFTLLSWFTFGVLLIGRHLYGWRGRVALRWTLLGFAFLLLSYTGSRFVLEIILQRGTIG